MTGKPPKYPDWYCRRFLAVPLIWQWRPHKAKVQEVVRRIRTARLVASCCWTEPGAT